MNTTTGMITLTEFEQLLKDDFNLELPKSDVQLMFNRFDNDNDG